MRDASTPTGNGDRFVLDLVKQSAKPAILLLNKPIRSPTALPAAAD
jgi:GTP-binding protein Era